MSTGFRFSYLVPLATVALALGCVTTPTDPEVLGADSGQGGRPTYGTPKEQGLVAVLAKDEAEFLASRPRPRGGAEIKANHSPRPIGQVVVGDIPLVAATPSGPPSISGADITNALPGTKIAISGSNFGVDKSVVKVVFTGDKEATIVSLADGKVEVNVPEGATDGPITITVGEREPATSAFPFDVHAAGAPTVTQIAPEIGKSGDVVTITGTNFGTDASKLEVAIGTTKLLVSEVTEVSDSQIKITVPQAFQDGPISVKKTDTATQKSDTGVSKATFKKQP